MGLTTLKRKGGHHKSQTTAWFLQLLNAKVGLTNPKPQHGSYNQFLNPKVGLTKIKPQCVFYNS